MCELAVVSRAGFYRQWEQQEPCEAEIALRDAIQRQGGCQTGAAAEQPAYTLRLKGVGEGLRVGCSHASHVVPAGACFQGGRVSAECTKPAARRCTIRAERDHVSYTARVRIIP